MYKRLKNSNICLSLLCILVYSFFLILLKCFDCNYFLMLRLNGIFLIINSVLFTLIYFKHNHSLLKPFFVFYVLLLFFSCGHILIMAFGIKPKDIAYIWRLHHFRRVCVTTAVNFSIFSLLFFQLGYFISKAININCKELKRRKFDLNINKIIKFIFYFCALDSLVYFLYIKINTNSYESIYTMDFGVFYKILLVLSYLVIPFYLLLNVKLKKIDTKSSIVMVFLIIMNFVIGKRGMAITYFVPLIFVYINNLKKLKLSHILLLTVIGYLTVTLIVTVSYVRVRDIELIDFFKLYLENLITFKSIILLINEMGYSIRPLVETIDGIDRGKIQPLLGGSYLYSIFLILPSFLRFGLDNIASKYHLVNLSSFITKYSGANYGIGFSTMAEAYINFEFLGIFVFILLGVIIGLLLEGHFFKNKKMNYYFHFAILSLIIVFPRSPMQDTIKKLLFYCIIPFVLYNWLNKEKETNESN